MENKEIKNEKTEELSDEALDEVTGGTYQLKDPRLGSVQVKSVQTPPGKITVPTKPVGFRK